MALDINLVYGLHTIHLRCKDANGYWSSVVSSMWNNILLNEQVSNKIIAYRYWFNSDVNNQEYVEIDNPQQVKYEQFNANATTLEPGLNIFHLQFKDSFGHWSSVLSESFNQYDLGVLEIQLKAFLEGPFRPESMNMTDDLREEGRIPLEEPYATLGYDHEFGGGEITTESVLGVTDENAIVDWIFVELRDGNNPQNIISTQSVLLQRDGDIVGVDGVSPLSFNAHSISSVFIAIRHRNHFGVRTSLSYPTNAPIEIDYTNTETAIFGDNSMLEIEHKRVLISGDANSDGQINSLDMNNFWRIENGIPFNYFETQADFDLNGEVNSLDKNKIWRKNNSMQEQLD